MITINDILGNVKEKTSIAILNDNDTFIEGGILYEPTKKQLNSVLRKSIKEIGGNAYKIYKKVSSLDSNEEIEKALNEYISITDSNKIIKNVTKNQENNLLTSIQILKNNYRMKKNRTIYDNSKLIFNEMTEKQISYFYEKFNKYEKFNRICEYFNENTTIYENKLIKDKNVLDNILKTNIVNAVIFVIYLFKTSDMNGCFTINKSFLVKLLAKGISKVDTVSIKSNRLSQSEFVDGLLNIIGIKQIKKGSVKHGTSIYEINPINRFKLINNTIDIGYIIDWYIDCVYVHLSDVLYDCSEFGKSPVRSTNCMNYIYNELVNPIISYDEYIIDKCKKDVSDVFKPTGAYLTQAHLDLYKSNYPDFTDMKIMNEIFSKSEIIKQEIEQNALVMLKYTTRLMKNKKKIKGNIKEFDLECIKHRNYMIEINEFMINESNEIKNMLENVNYTRSVERVKKELAKLDVYIQRGNIFCKTLRSPAGRSICVAGYDLNNAPKYIRNLIFNDKVSVDISTTVYRTIIEILRECYTLGKNKYNRDEINNYINNVELYVSNKNKVRKKINNVFGLPDNSDFAKRLTSIISMSYTNIKKCIDEILNDSQSNSSFTKLIREFKVENKIKLMPIEVYNLAEATGFAINYVLKNKTMTIRGYVNKNKDGNGMYHNIYQTMDENGRLYAPNINSDLTIKSGYSIKQTFANVFCSFETMWIDSISEQFSKLGYKTIGYVHDNIILDTNDVESVAKLLNQDHYNVELIKFNREMVIDYIEKNSKKNSNIMINKRNSRFMRSNRTERNSTSDFEEVDNNKFYDENIAIEMFRQFHQNNMNGVSNDVLNEQMIEYSMLPYDFNNTIKNKNESKIDKFDKNNFTTDQLYFGTDYWKNKTKNFDHYNYEIIQSVGESYDHINPINDKSKIVELNLRWNIALQKAMKFYDKHLYACLTNVFIIDTMNFEFIIDNKSIDKHSEEHDDCLSKILKFLNSETNYIFNEDEWKPGTILAKNILSNKDL